MPDTKISLDEVMDLRKDFAGANGSLNKAFAAPPSWNDEERSAVFTMSAESVDRMGDIVVQEGMDTDEFMKNPQGLMFHNSRSWPVGKWSDIKRINGRPKRTEGKITLLPAGVEPDADRAAGHLKHGTIRTVSIGFSPKEYEAIKDDDGHWTGIKFTASELLECSLVPIPALREARVKDGGFEFTTMPPEAIEEFLEHLKMHPAVARMVAKERYEEAFFEATGNKLISIPAIEAEPAPVDEKAIESTFVKDLEEFSEEWLKLHTPPAETEIKKSLTQRVLDTVKGLFAPEQEIAPVVIHEVKKADPEAVSAASARLAALKSRQAA